MDANFDDTQTEENDHGVLSAATGAVRSLLQKLTPGNDVHSVKWDESDVYSTGDHRGIAVVITNETFRGHTARKGSQLDTDNLCNAFSTLGFQVRVVKDCSVQELKHVLQSVAKEDHSRSDCFVLAMSTHGDESIQDTRQPTRKTRDDVVFCTDFYLTTKELLLHFSDQNCPTLKGKPRLFFLQACRGGQLDDGQQVKVIYTGQERMGTDEVDAAMGEEVVVSPAPCFMDFLVMYATPPGFYAFRRPTEGSWFVQALCSVLERSDGSQSILQLLTSVIGLVAKEYISRTPLSVDTDRKKQTPCIYSMLTKNLYLKVSKKKGEILTWS